MNFVCLHCGKEFQRPEPKKSRKWCSPSCRQRAFEERHEAERDAVLMLLKLGYSVVKPDSTTEQAAMLLLIKLGYSVAKP